jgi:hypothetical protein
MYIPKPSLNVSRHNNPLKPHFTLSEPIIDIQPSRYSAHSITPPVRALREDDEPHEFGIYSYAEPPILSG